MYEYKAVFVTATKCNSNQLSIDQQYRLMPILIDCLLLTDPVKTLIAKEGGGQLLCARLQQLMARHEAGQLSAGDAEVESLVKQACELLIVVLTGGNNSLKSCVAIAQI